MISTEELEKEAQKAASRTCFPKESLQDAYRYGWENGYRHGYEASQRMPEEPMCRQGHRHLKPPRVFVLRSAIAEFAVGDGPYQTFEGNQFEVQWDDDVPQEHIPGPLECAKGHDLVMNVENEVYCPKCTPMKNRRHP